MNTPDSLENHAPREAGSFTVPLGIALLQLILQVSAQNNYGYFRDELYYIACSDHLAWGYVDQPPLSIALLSLNRWILGDSLHALRFLPALAGSAVIILTALLSRRLGGGRIAQGLSALCVFAAHSLLGNGRYFSMNAFDVLFWTAAAYCLVRIVQGSEKFWLAFGVIAGLGLLNKYSMGFMVAGTLAGLVLTPCRVQLRSKWFWFGAVSAMLIFLPHLLWEISQGYPTLEFIRNASQNKNVSLSIPDFFIGQFKDLNFFNSPLWLMGLFFLFFHSQGKKYRIMGWIYVTAVVIILSGNPKVYYLSPVYPVLFAAGSVMAERFVITRRWLIPAYASLMIASTLAALPFAVPVLPVNSFVAYQEMLGATPRSEERTPVGVLPQYYADEFGWEEMVATVSQAYHSLTPEEQAQCVIYVRNYGEAGAIDFFGKRYGLPKALCAHNNYWLWGPGKLPGHVAIVFGGSRDLDENSTDLRRRFKRVDFVGTTNCRYCMPYENGRQIFVCREMNTTFQELWPGERFYI